MKRAAAFAFLVFWVLLSRTPALSTGTERIVGYHSLVTVQGDGVVVVRETIRVVAAGRKIKRGIYRAFPTRYRDRFGNRVKVRFDVLEVTRDGRPEAYHLRSDSGGEKVYIGRKSVFLDPGEYTYTLTYRTDRQIGFFEDFDELYWNVTGNEWEFLIEKASAEIRLPDGARALNYVAYTGPRGGKGRDYTAGREGERIVTFASTRPLRPGEGLTVAVSWPKGVIAEPALSDRAGDLLRDNPSAMVALAGMLLLQVYFLFAWTRVGRDPPPGAIVTNFAPPEGYSPAAVRYVMRMGYSDRVFAAAIVNMAVKGYLTIEDESGTFTLRRTEADRSALSRGEKKIAGKLFGGRRSIELKNTNHRSIGGAVKALKKSLREDFDKINFRLNSRWLVPGAMITLLVLAGMVAAAGDREKAVFMAVWLGVWTVGCAGMFVKMVQSWKAVLGGGGARHLAGAIMITAFASPFFVGEIAGLVMFAGAASPAAAAIFILIILSNVIFYILIKAPTMKGRRIMDQIEGFRVFLEATEKDRLERMNPPEKTPELFEKFLPYALALGVENAWSEKFAGVLARAGEGGRGYRPGWYSGGRLGSFDPSGMASSLGSSFASAISSSAAAPGSSSGSGGGGFSGGGGGGGGGGGW